tara:strand:+ start:8653 stop:9330 length:678 start_codon:yes stop_codon:yes gene_type:complete
MLLFVSTQIQAQKFSLSTNQITDSLYINGTFEDGIDLTNNSPNRILVKWRVLENTIDTANWEILYCSYPSCRAEILSEEVCDTIEKLQKVRVSNLNIITEKNPKNCQLKIELFDILDSSYRDTLTYALYASSTDKITGIDNPAIAGNGMKNIEIFPNPASNSVGIKVPIEIETIRLIDFHGREVLSQPVGEEEFSLDVSSLQRGVYWVLGMSAKGGTYHSKLILE